MTDLITHKHTEINTSGSRIGRFMHTSNGQQYWPLDPRPEEVHLEVVAHHLATRARYNGATQHPIYHDRILYSVAEHSVLVSRFLEEVMGRPDLALEGLLHDGSEAYNGDLIRPLKYDKAFKAPFQVVEELNENAGAKRFELAYPYPKEVKIADEAVTAAEMQQIIVRDPRLNWSTKTYDDTHVAPYEIEMLAPFVAKMQFIDRFRELATKRRVPGYEHLFQLASQSHA